MHHINSKKKKHRVKHALSNISPHTVKFLKPLLLVIMVEFLWFGISFYIDISSDPIGAIAFYSVISEYLMMSLLLSIGFGVLFDISISEIDKK